MVESVAYLLRPLFLSGPDILNNGSFQFTWTDPDNLNLSVLATTNLSLPTASWTVLGPSTPLGGGAYRFIDPGVNNYPRRFYKLRSP